MSTFNTHGGYFAPKDYTRIDTGGSHEENPNGGVQLGVDPEGIPNLLEEGEPVYKDYVFSDNIKAKKSWLEENNIPVSYADKLYSEIADAFVDEAEERPNDPISRNGLEAMLTRLAAAQEAQKQEDQMKELQDILSDLSPEELAELEAQLSQDQFLAAPEQAAPTEVSSEVIAPEEVPLMSCGGKMRRYPDGGMLPETFVYARGNRMPQIAAPALRIPQNVALAGELPLGTPRLALSPVTVTETAQSMPAFSQYATTAQNINLAGERPLGTPHVALDPVTVTETAKAMPTFSQYATTGKNTSLAGISNMLANSKAARTYTPVDDDNELVGIRSALPTFARYAKGIGAGLLGAYNAFQEPDHYEVSRAIPYAPYGNINLQNQRYVAVDPNMVLNTQLAQANSTARAIQNSGTPSANAALLALDNNTGRNIGTGLLQTIQANNQQRNAVMAANNQAEAQRAQFDYGVDRGRVMGLDMAQRQNLQNELMLQRLNNEAEGQKYAAVSNQINAGLDALTGIGQENFAINQINSNTALNGYGLAPNGIGGYMLVPTQKRSCGGLLKKFKK